MPHTSFDLIDRAASLGFHALAITLHDTQFSDDRTLGYARERELVLIPGVERTIRGRHVLLLNFPPGAADAVHTLDDVARVKGRTDGLVIAPHPYFPARSCLRGALEAYAPVFDAVEWSYFWMRGIDFNGRAAAWARAHDKPVVGNSDLHVLSQLGRTHSRVDAPADAGAICAAIRAGRVTVETTPVPVAELAAVLGVMALRPQKRTKSAPGVGS